VYELEQKTRSATSPDAYADTDIDTRALEVLRLAGVRDKYKYKAGDLYPPQTQKVNHYGVGVVEEPVSEFWADEMVGIDDLIHDTQGRELTTNEEFELKAMQRAKEALLKPRKRPPRYLSQCLDWYCENRRSPDKWLLTGVKYNQMNNRFLEIMAFIGDHLTEDPNVDRRIAEGLEMYAEDRSDNSKLKGQTIRRYLKEPIAAFKEVSRRFGLNWKINAPDIEDGPVKRKNILSFEEQQRFVQWCVNKDDMYAAILLTQLHGGLMATELARLSIDMENSIILDGSQPYLFIKEKTKKEARKRIVPLVLGVEVIQRHLKEGIEWLAKYKASTHSTTLKAQLLEATGNSNITAHCLRHTWNYNATIEAIDLVHRTLLAGWGTSSKQSPIDIANSVTYGKQGLQQAPMVIALANTQRKVLKHLIGIKPTTENSTNVISIHSRS